VAVNFRKARRGSVKKHAKSFQLGTLNIDVPPGRARQRHVGVGGAVSDVARLGELAQPQAHRERGRRRASSAARRSRSSARRRTPSPTSRTSRRRTSGSCPATVIRWTCRYRNGTEKPVTFGVTAEDEMCFAVGFFVHRRRRAIPDCRRTFCFGSLGLVSGN
jgi:hypothetical protein